LQKQVKMVVNTNKRFHNISLSNQVDFLKLNRPGIYFLFNKNKELIYVGESKFPLTRILDHYFKHYKKNPKDKGVNQKGIGPVFQYFRIMEVRGDKRIRQHFEKRWMRKFKSPMNLDFNHRNAVCYDLSYREINAFIKIYDDFFSNQMTWHRYIQDEVCRHRRSYMIYRRKQRKINQVGDISKISSAWLNHHERKGK